MPVWGWVLLTAGLSALAVAAVGLIVRGTHRLHPHEPLHGDVENIAAPLPLDVAEREEPAERPRDTSVR